MSGACTVTTPTAQGEIDLLCSRLASFQSGVSLVSGVSLFFAFFADCLFFSGFPPVIPANATLKL